MTGESLWNVEDGALGANFEALGANFGTSLYGTCLWRCASYLVPLPTGPAHPRPAPHLVYSHAPNMCTENSCHSEIAKCSAFFRRVPSLCNEKTLLMRPRSGKFEPSQGLGCHFLDQKVAHHTPCMTSMSTACFTKRERSTKAQN